MPRPNKRLGQHFLHSSPVIARILQVIDARPGQHLVEIGPGHGAITRPLLESDITLDVVELDRGLITDLEALAGTTTGRLQVHHCNALEFDVCACKAGDEQLRLVGNLPYNISTPLIFHVLEQRRCIRDMHFMLQKEVVERMAASPGGKEYGRLSVMVQYHCAIHPLFNIGPAAFHPPPKVESSFVRLIPHAQPPVAVTDPELFAVVVKRAFMYRRKTLRNALRGMIDDNGFSAADVDPELRAERLSLTDFARLTAQASR